MTEIDTRTQQEIDERFKSENRRLIKEILIGLGFLMVIAFLLILDAKLDQMGL